MSTLPRRVQDVFVDNGFGFPVELHNVPMVLVRGVWTPDIDYNLLEQRVLGALALKPSRLTGDEIRFIRSSFAWTLQQFATRFNVSHPAVIKWERRTSRPTSMDWATEKDIRLELLRQTRATAAAFLRAYVSLQHSAPSEPQTPTAIELGAMVSLATGKRRSYPSTARP